MPLNRERKKIRSQSRGFLKAISCLLEITTLKSSQQQHQHIVKKLEEMFDSSLAHYSFFGGGVVSWEKRGKMASRDAFFFFDSFTLNKAKHHPET